MGMGISISEQNRERIRGKVESGIYASADDVLMNALDLLDLHDIELERELAEMKEAVRIGTEQADAGILIPAEEVFDEIRRRNAEIVRKKHNSNMKQ